MASTSGAIGFGCCDSMIRLFLTISDGVLEGKGRIGTGIEQGL